MRDREFRQWLARREYQGTPLTAKGVNNRARKAPRIERALAELGFAERDLDTLHANGRWPAVVDAVRRVAADWHANEAAARKMAPQASDPTRQLTTPLVSNRNAPRRARSKRSAAKIDEASERRWLLDRGVRELRSRLGFGDPNARGDGHPI